MRPDPLTGTVIPCFTYDTPDAAEQDFYELCEGPLPLVLVFLSNFGHPISREYLMRYVRTLPALQSGRLACVVRSQPQRIAEGLGGGTFPFPLICDAEGVLYEHFGIRSSASRLRWTFEAQRIFRRAQEQGYVLQKSEPQLLPLTLAVGPGGQILFAHHGQSLTDLPEGAHLVDEGGLTFEVNFSTRLDCGIFLDHRETRSRIREMMKQTLGSKRFLNLFAYTGTATCYAADGGAKHTTTVDLSRPSLDWARRNMARNGFRGPEHEFVQADVLSYINEQRHSPNRWDLVFCDVPTFSNSQRMRKSSFDVQRDHVELIIGVSRLLTRNGSAIFSCNLRGFKPDVEALKKAGVVLEDITEETIPEDFQRNKKIHHCYIVKRG